MDLIIYDGFNNLCLTRKSTIWYLLNLSNNLQIIDVKLIYLFLEPFLNKGMMFASFYLKGIITSFNNKLNTLVNGILICSIVSISSFEGIPSTLPFLGLQSTALKLP